MSNENSIKTVAVFASSRDLINPVFNKAACDLGLLLAEQGYQAYFGGLFSGLMNDFARAILDNNGQLTGYLPKNLAAYANKVDVSAHYEERLVGSTDESRAFMFKNADAAIALPGGLGTNVEIWGFVEQQYLLFYETPQKPVNPMILFNVAGYYDELALHLAQQVKEGAVNKGHANIVQVVQNIGGLEKILTQVLKSACDYSTDIKIKRATV